MSAQQGGSFATLLLVIPLAAIPLMAIFGIPEFAHLTAAEDPNGPGIVRRPPAESSDDSHSAQVSTTEYQNRAADLFVPRDDEAKSGMTQGSASSPSHFRIITNTSGARAGGDFAARDRAVDAFTTSDSPSTHSQRPLPRPMPTSARQSTAAEALSTQLVGATESGLTWREAARRLQEVGITDYRLEHGHRSDRFLFVCRFSPGSDPRVIRRFEAESPEPLAAVEDVLTQVERWLQHRYVESRRWVR